MNIINHQSNGAKGLRIAATVCIVLGWLAFVFCFIGGCVAEDVNFFAPFGVGVAALVVMYLFACVMRALASMAEFAQLYFELNAPREDNE